MIFNDIIELTYENIGKLNQVAYVRLLKQLSDTIDDDIDIRLALSNLIELPYKVFILGSLDKPIGSITLIIEQKIIHNCGRVGHIEDVIVDSKRRGNGYSNMLINKAIETAKEYGCYKVLLHCDETLIKFYEKFGFFKINGMRVNL